MMFENCLNTDVIDGLYYVHFFTFSDVAFNNKTKYANTATGKMVPIHGEACQKS